MFFVSYVLFVFFILMNIFLAIINDTYSLVKTEIAVQKNDVEISEFVMRGYNNLVGNMSQRDREVDLENALLMSRADNGDINYEELRQAAPSGIWPHSHSNPGVILKRLILVDVRVSELLFSSSMPPLSPICARNELNSGCSESRPSPSIFARGGGQE